MARSVLVIDDEPEVLRLFETILTSGGYLVVLADSGVVARQMIKDGAFDLLILDLCMPPPDGFELLKELRASNPAPPVLVVSGYLQGVMLKAAQLMGATATLAKRDAPGLLLSTVRAIFQL